MDCPVYKEQPSRSLQKGLSAVRAYFPFIVVVSEGLLTGDGLGMLLLYMVLGMKTFWFIYFAVHVLFAKNIERLNKGVLI